MKYYSLGRAVFKLGVALFLMSVAQNICDATADNYSAGTIRDVSYRYLGDLGNAWVLRVRVPHFADYMILASYAALLLSVILIRRRRVHLIARYIDVLSNLFLLRALILPLTIYPEGPFTVGLPRWSPRNVWYGALYVVTGLRVTTTDFMPSGHTMGWALALLFLHRHTPLKGVHLVLRAVQALTFVLGLAFIVFAGQHYTADVVLSIFISYALYHFHHHERRKRKHGGLL